MELHEALKELARRGGEANLKKYGKEFYKELSQKGVKARERNKKARASKQKT